MAVTDIILLVIMLVGLLRLRRQCCGTFGLARLLWKQVRCLFSLAVLTGLRFMNLSSFRELFGAYWPPWLRFCQQYVWLVSRSSSFVYLRIAGFGGFEFE
jgi:hypothetical protein